MGELIDVLRVVANKYGGVQALRSGRGEWAGIYAHAYFAWLIGDIPQSPRKPDAISEDEAAELRQIAASFASVN